MGEKPIKRYLTDLLKNKRKFWRREIEDQKKTDCDAYIHFDHNRTDGGNR